MSFKLNEHWIGIGVLLLVLMICVNLPVYGDPIFPEGSFEECYMGSCYACEWDCKGPDGWPCFVCWAEDHGVPLYDGGRVGWIGGWIGDEIAQTKLCIELPYFYQEYIRWHWTAKVPEDHPGNVIRASIDGEIVFEKTLTWPEDHTWGTWNEEYTNSLNAYCERPAGQIFCIEIIPTNGASYLVDYFEFVGLCWPIVTDESTFSTVKSLY